MWNRKISLRLPQVSALIGMATLFVLFQNFDKVDLNKTSADVCTKIDPAMNVCIEKNGVAFNQCKVVKSFGSFRFDINEQSCLAMVGTANVSAVYFKNEKLPRPALVYKNVTFYVHPDFLKDQEMKEIQTNLKGYIDDLNIILAKTTVLRLTFDQNNVRTDGYSNIASCADSLIDENFEIDINIDGRSNLGVSHGGTASCDGFNKNRILIKGMAWNRIYSRDEIGKAELEALTPDFDDYYMHQLTTLAHELAHVMGAGYGEYYALNMDDLTGVLPNLKINQFDENNFYWNSRRSVEKDPLLARPYPKGSAILKYARYSGLTSKIINTAVQRKGTIQYGHFTSSPSDAIKKASQPVVVRVIDRDSRLPVSSCKVGAYRQAMVNSSYVIAEAKTNATGLVRFDIGQEVDGTMGKRFALFKANCTGYEPIGDAISKFDLEARYVNNGGQNGDFRFNGTIVLEARPEAAPSRLVYSETNAVYNLGKSIKNNIPSANGGSVTSYEVYPNLPNGLWLDTIKGVIYGTPQNPVSRTTYKITARNAYGATYTEIVVEVSP